MEESQKHYTKRKKPETKGPHCEFYLREISREGKNIEADVRLVAAWNWDENKE